VPNADNVPASLKKIQKLWAGFSQPVSYYALIYNFKDKAWALKADAKVPVVASNGGTKGRASMSSVITQCTPTNCGMANSGISDAAGNGYGQFMIDPAEKTRNPFIFMGGTFGHEYTHSVQAAQFLGNSDIGKPVSKKREAVGLDNSPSGLFQGVLPCWMTEGMANFNGQAVVASTFHDYMIWRTGAPKSQQIPSFTDYSATSLLKVLNDGTNPFSCLPPSPKYLLGYTIGALVIEALTAVAGPQSDMAVVTLLGRGQTFAQAFKNVYGISWASAAPILARVAAAEYAATR
jgi:hypothetical protein